MIPKYLVLILLLVGAFGAKAQYNYPKTKTVDSIDAYFGNTYKDPYRWLENLKDSNVINWFKQQKDFADNTMKNLGGVDSLLNQLQRYMGAKTWGREPMHKSDHRYYYSLWERGQLSQNLYYKTITDTSEHLILDSWNIHPGMRYQMAAIDFSPNEKYFFAAFDKNGEEYPFIKVYDIDSNKWLKDSIPHCWPNTIKWTADSKGFIYGYNTGDRNIPTATENDVVKYHAVNTTNGSDYTVMDDKIRNTVEMKISNSYSAYVDIMNGSQRIYFYPNAGQFEYGNVYYINNDELLSPDKHWKKLYAKEDSVLDVKETPSGYYFISAKGTGFKSLRYTSYNNPDFANTKIIFPEDMLWQLETVDETKSYLLVSYSKYGFINKTIFVDKISGTQINVPVIANYDRFSIATMGTKTDECIFYRSYVNKPGKGYLLNIANNILTDEDFWAPHGQTFIDGSDDIVSELIEVPSYDGTLIPMSIMRNKNTKLDGNNICIINGYGAYGIAVKDNTLNQYNPVNNLFVQRSIILVHAYVRGGGEKGEAWHKAGMKENKPNSWKDFIDCAEYLIKNKYTNPSKFACYGGSAGGVLIGRTITERPDLFAAAHVQSGSMNLIRGKAWANQIGNYPEFGNPDVESEMKGIIEMDAVIHVKPNTKYPAVYLTTGINDNRVASWMPGKFAATLQANNTSDKPVLLYTNFEGGHFGDANAPSMIEMYRTNLKPLFFLLWQCGHKDFQPK
jgi:prolyl oligopeptidase